MDVYAEGVALISGPTDPTRHADSVPWVHTFDSESIDFAKRGPVTGPFPRTSRVSDSRIRGRDRHPRCGGGAGELGRGSGEGREGGPVTPESVGLFPFSNFPLLI